MAKNAKMPLRIREWNELGKFYFAIASPPPTHLTPIAAVIDPAAMAIYSPNAELVSTLHL
jgi:hypothetical protein